ncbi:hypothetical protein MyNCGM152_46410 [Achromobacter xylosoxidans]
MTLRVNLSYYNREHKRLLTSTQPYASIGTAAKVSFFNAHSTISKADFYSYLLIHRQALSGYKSYDERRTKIDKAEGWISDIVTSNASTLQLAQAGYRDAAAAERIGESVGLSVISRLHGMTNADWTRLDTLPGVNGFKTFDFQIGSDGIRIIQVETKGSFVDDCTTKPSTVSQHAGNIDQKKKELAGHLNHPQPSSVRYGTITAIDSQNDTKCWLLDPPAEDLQINPFDLRIAKRLGFTAKAIAAIAPQATLPDIIAKRINQMLRRGTKSFDGDTLETDAGTPFSSKSYVERFLSKDKIFFEELDIVGKIVQISPEIPLFIGIKGDLARSAINQDLQEISRLSFNQSDLGIREISTNNASPERIPMKFQTSSGGFIVGSPV